MADNGFVYTDDPTDACGLCVSPALMGDDGAVLPEYRSEPVTRLYRRQHPSCQRAYDRYVEDTRQGNL